MFRFFQRRRQRRAQNQQDQSHVSASLPLKAAEEVTEITNPEAENSLTTGDEESIYSASSGSSSLDELDDHPPTYTSHSFQQQFHELHPAGEKMTNLSSFMLKPSSRDKVGQPPTQPAWWNFERDYKEEADTSMNFEIEEEEDEEEEIAFVDQSKMEDTPEEHLQFAKHAFIKTRIDELNLDRSPCSESDNDDHSFENFDSNDLNAFLQDEPVRPPDEPNVEQCFKNIKLMTPEDFDTLKEATAKEKQAEQTQSPSLSTMVHAVDPKLFEESADHSDLSMSIVSHQSAATNVSMSTNPESILQMSRYSLTNTSPNKYDDVRKKLASSFKSRQSGKNRVSYNLSKGKKGMSKKERLYATSLLPAKPLLSAKQRSDSSSAVPRSITLRSPLDRPLSILLLSPIAKIFEIVLVDAMTTTTIGDALSKARATASDETLSEQKYISLCNRKQELAAPMLPVSLLIEKFRRGRTEEERRRAMEGRLLVAVPEGSTSTECQAIRRMLWKNPRVQRWWKLSDPFRRPDDQPEEEEYVSSDEEDYIEVPEQTKTNPQPTKQEKKKTAKKSRRDVKIKYHRLTDDEDEDF